MILNEATEGRKGAKLPREQKKNARKFLAGFLLIALAGSGIYALLYIFLPAGLENIPQDPSDGKVQGQSAENLAKDSDLDGLKDWEEIFYRTDPQKADSDGDATPDGEEISGNRDPLKPGPDDQLSEPAQTDTTASGQIMSNEELLREAAEKNVNLTDYFVNKLLDNGGIEALTKPGADKQIGDEFAAYLQNLVPNETFTPDSIPDSEIIISPAEDNTSVKNYFNSVAAIYEKYIPPLKGADELQFLTSALEQENSEPLDAVIPMIDALEKMEGEIKKLPAPTSLVSLHKQELWYLQKGIAEIGLIEKADPQDAVYALVIMSGRIKTRRAATEFHGVTVVKWLKNRSINFSPDDEALLLYPGLAQ